MIYVYAILADPLDDDEVADIRGIADAPVTRLSEGDLTAVITRHADVDGAPAPDADTVWQHEGVVEALLSHDALLPARFGTTFPRDADLADALSRHRDTLRAGLGRVHGCVELGVRALGSSEAADDAFAGQPVATTAAGHGGGGAGQRSRATSDKLAPAQLGSGRAYMLARAAEERRRQTVEDRGERIAAEIHDPLARRARDSVRRRLPTPDLLLSAAYLVGREDVGAFRDAVGELAASHPFVRLLCTGPWPPYNFVPQLGRAEVTRG